MKTITPTRSFLRVHDKYFPSYISRDINLDPGASLLYIYLFRASLHKDRCWLSQDMLASMTKYSRRSIQNYLQQLVSLEYIQIVRRRGHNVYILLLSERVRQLISQAGIDMIDASKTSVSAYRVGTQSLHEECAESAHDLRKTKKETTPPLPPLPFSTPQAGGNSFREAQRFFNGIWGLWPTPANVKWPMHHDPKEGFRAVLTVARSGKLPTIETAVAAIEYFKAEDIRWRAGYPPAFRNWIRRLGWCESAQKTPTVTSTRESLSPTPELPPQLRARLDEIHRLPVSAHHPLSTADIQAVDVLCTMWPQKSSRTPVEAFFMHMREAGKTLCMPSLLTAAQRYLAESKNPGGLIWWLRSVTSCPSMCC